jgi:hypothetical protein
MTMKIATMIPLADITPMRISQQQQHTFAFCGVLYVAMAIDPFYYYSGGGTHKTQDKKNGGGGGDPGGCE